MAFTPNNVYQEDCIKGLRKIEPGSIDLVFADPPFNIGYEYDIYHDSRSSGEYLDWTRQWMSGVWHALKANGTFWLAIGDEYAAELKVTAQRDVGFTCRSWVIWYYTFGVNCRCGFSRSHTHLVHFVKNPHDFTFNADNPTIRVQSARQLVYADGRANPFGRLPDNTWILRPQDVPNGFRSTDDTWYFSRVAGTFKERQGFHGCQMPEQLLGRIIRGCSNPMEIVMDPFGGSGTTFAVAKKLGRQWIGFELSKDYVEKIRLRLKNTNVGNPLDGPADPLSSAPPTALGKRRHRPPVKALANGINLRKRLSRDETSEIVNGIVAAYQAVHGGWSVDRLLANPNLNNAFIDACARKGLPGGPVQWNLALLRVRKAGRLPRAEKRLRGVAFDQMDAYSFASEIAVQQLSVELGVTLDDILCSPQLGARFDEMAQAYSPGFAPFQYRWAALTIRKRASAAKKIAKEQRDTWSQTRLPPARPIFALDLGPYDCPGVYLLHGAARARLYVGVAQNLQWQIEYIREIPTWRSLDVSSVSLIHENDDARGRGRKSFLIDRIKPAMNWQYLGAEVKGTA
jgi:site-specific DNA-methyltransferase (adenine-specific)